MLRAEKKWQRHRKPHGHGPERGLLSVLFRYYMYKGFHDGIQVGSGFHSARAVREKKEADAKAQKVVKDAEASSRGKCGGFRASCSHAGLPEGLELRVMPSGGNSRQLSGWQFPPHRSSTRSRARSSRAACFSSLIGFFSEWHPLKDMSPVATRMKQSTSPRAETLLERLSGYRIYRFPRCDGRRLPDRRSEGKRRRRQKPALLSGLSLRLR